MDVEFATKKLEKCYLDVRQATMMWGEIIARKYIQRIALLQEASNMREVEELPGLDCHRLKGKRKGQHAVTLHDRWRLIFRLSGEKAEVIRVEEVNKHYGD